MIKKQNNSDAQGTNEQGGKVEKLSRRIFLNSAGCAAMGGLAVAAGASLFTEKKAMATATQEAPSLPWKYVKLDPMEAGKRGYKNYLLNGG